MSKKWLIVLMMALPLSFNSFAQGEDTEEEEPIQARPNPMENRVKNLGSHSAVMAEEEEAQSRTMNKKAVKMQMKQKVMEKKANTQMNKQMQQQGR